MDTTSSTPPNDRTLRIITISGFFISFSLLLPYGINYGAVPTIDIIPCFFSSLVGALALRNRLRSRYVRIWLDALLAIMSIAFLIPSWATIGDPHGLHWNRPSGPTILGTYGTVPLMLNFAIHTFLVLREVPKGIPGLILGSQTCPHCHRAAGDAPQEAKAAVSPQMPARSRTDFMSAMGLSRSNKRTYQPLTEHDDEAPRESCDVQTSMYPSTRPSEETRGSMVKGGKDGEESLV